MSNRFAILNLDDSDVETNVPLKPIVDEKKNPKPFSKVVPDQKKSEKQEFRKWKKNDLETNDRRNWHLEEKKETRQPFRPFSKGNVFRESHGQRRYAKQKNFRYLFQDDEEQMKRESPKHTTPESKDISGQEVISEVGQLVPEIFQTIKESTLAEKIRLALEKQEKDNKEKLMDISGASYMSLKLNRVISK